MKMDPDLLRTLAQPATGPDREALLALGQLWAEPDGPYLLQGAEPDLVRVSWESPEGGPARISPGAKAPGPARVRNGMKLRPPRAEKAEPISGAGGAGARADFRLVPVRGACEQDADLEGAQPAALASSEQAGPVGLPDLHLLAEEPAQEEPAAPLDLHLVAEEPAQVAPEGPPDLHLLAEEPAQGGLEGPLDLHLPVVAEEPAQGGPEGPLDLHVLAEEPPQEGPVGPPDLHLLAEEPAQGGLEGPLDLHLVAEEPAHGGLAGLLDLHLVVEEPAQGGPVGPLDLHLVTEEPAQEGPTGLLDLHLVAEEPVQGGLVGPLDLHLVAEEPGQEGPAGVLDLHLVAEEPVQGGLVGPLDLHLVAEEPIQEGPAGLLDLHLVAEEPVQGGLVRPLDLHLVAEEPVQGGLVRPLDLHLVAEEPAQGGLVGPLDSHLVVEEPAQGGLVGPLDLHLVAEEPAQEGPAGLLDLHLVAEEPAQGGPVLEASAGLPAGRDLLFAMESPREEVLFDGLLFSSSWTPDGGSGKGQSCPGSPLLRRLDLAPQVGKGVGLFPAFCSPGGDLGSELELGEAEHHLGEERPGSPDDSPRLQAVFDALDRDGDGFVRIEEFIQFATVYGAEQVKDLTKFLDPAGLGVISFEDFYRGITAIRNGADPDSQLCTMGYTHEEEESPASTCPDEFDDFVTFEANEVTDSAYMGSESTYSECETFTDEDTSTLVHHEMHDEVETDSAIDSAVHSEYTDPIEEPENGSHPCDLPLSSDINSHSIVTVISGEEQFEDYGEGNEADLFSDSLCNGESSYTSSSFLSPSANPLTTKLHGIITGEAFEFYCSQCHKQINRLEDLSARLSDLEMNSPNKRLSSKKVARHLHQTGTLTVDMMEESFQNNTECLEEDIADKVIFLEKRVTELEKDTAANGEQHSRLKQENLQLVHRANALEEQLKEQELRADEILMEEIRKQRELLSKMEREKSIAIENLQARLQQLDEENGELRSCVPCLRANIERLEEEKRKLLDEIEDLTAQLNEELESKRKLGDKLNHERHEFQRDKESTQELIEDLRKQLEHLQLFKLEAEQRRGRSSSIGLQEYNSRTRETELEQEIRRLKQDNRNLKEQNDELNGQIINLSIQGAKNLFSASFSESLAAEISSVSRDELMEATQKQKEINLRLQDYIDRIIVAIMETNPSILEVN